MRNLPIWAIMLDVFGTFLLAGGLFLFLSGSSMMGMSSEQLKGPAIGLIVGGVLLMIPLLVALLKRRG